MKKQFAVLFALVFALTFSVKAQSSADFSIPTDLQGVAGETVFVPVFVELNDVCNIDMYVDFDPAVLTFVGIANTALPGTIGNLDGGSVKVSWSAPAGSSLVGHFVDIQFTYHGGESVLALDQNPLFEVNDCTAGLVPINYTVSNGFISEAPPIPVPGWSIYLGFGLIVVFVAFGLGRKLM